MKTGLLLLPVLAMYALQVASPLRLNTDAVTILSMAESAARGSGFLEDGRATVIPPGYPAFVSALLKVGLATPVTLIGWNLVFTICGLIAACDILAGGAWMAGAQSLAVASGMTLTSFVLIKHFTLPLTDVAFFGVATCAVAAMDRLLRRGIDRRFLALAALVWVAMTAAIAVRRIGVALIPAFFAVAALHPGLGLRVWEGGNRKTLLVWIAFLAAGIAAVGAAAATTARVGFDRGDAHPSAIGIASYRITELGELAINVPLSKMPLPVQWIVPLAGAAVAALIAAGVIRRRKSPRPSDIYFCGYGAVLFVWPYYDTRFWLPVVPLLIGYAAAAIGPWLERGFAKAAVTAYCALFVLAGWGALAYSTRVSLSGAGFPEIYGGGSLRPSYCAAFGTCAGTYSAADVNPKIVRLLEIFR